VCSQLLRRKEIGGSWWRPAWAKLETLSEKLTKARLVDVDKLMEYLPNKCKVLSSISSTTKKKKKKKHNPLAMRQKGKE
jgi:hypothetical protein